MNYVLLGGFPTGGGGLLQFVHSIDGFEQAVNLALRFKAEGYRNLIVMTEDSYWKDGPVLWTLA